jgi:hypothetical protein
MVNLDGENGDVTEVWFALVMYLLANQRQAWSVANESGSCI